MQCCVKIASIIASKCSMLTALIMVHRPGSVCESIPKGNNELVGPQQAKKVVDEEVFQLPVPHSGVVAGGIVGAGGISQAGSPSRGWGWRRGGWGW